MVFADTTLTPTTGYAAVNQKQIYDAIAASLGAHSNWALVDTVDAVISTNTFRTFVWKCKAAGSGLPADFYVAFRLQFVTSTGLWSTNALTGTHVFEGYDAASHTASKMAMVYSTTVQTLAADGSNTSTWTLTSAPSITAPNNVASVGLGSITVSTSTRLLILAAKETLIVFQNATGSTLITLYAGAMETLMSATDDPMPVILAAGTTTGQNLGAPAHIASTRHPKLSGSQSGVFGFASSIAHAATTSGNNLASAPWLTTVGNGVLGTAGDTTLGMFLSTVIVSKACIASAGTGSGSTKGGLRGFFWHIGVASTAAPAFGDTFLVDGAVWASSGSSTGVAMIDTTAA